MPASSRARASARSLGGSGAGETARGPDVDGAGSETDAPAPVADGTGVTLVATLPFVSGRSAAAAGRLSVAGAPTDVPSAASSVSTGTPCETLSPTWSLNSFTTPAAGEGTSIVALSD